MRQQQAVAAPQKRQSCDYRHDKAAACPPGACVGANRAARTHDSRPSSSFSVRHDRVGSSAGAGSAGRRRLSLAAAPPASVSLLLPQDAQDVQEEIDDVEINIEAAGRVRVGVGGMGSAV